MESKVKSSAKTGDIIKVVILAIILIWILCFFIDYFRARNAKSPFFCLHKETIKYDDGETFVCTGLGYKYIKYDRNSIKTTVEFGPFFMKEKK